MNKRKHYTQMSPKELHYLRSEIDKLGTFDFTDYAEVRMKERDVAIEDVLKSIYYGKIIEVHNNNYKVIRVLLRYQMNEYYICTVVDLFKKSIITVYKNKKEDDHFTLNWSQYEWYVDIVDYINEMKKQYISIKYPSSYEKR